MITDKSIHYRCKAWNNGIKKCSDVRQHKMTFVLALFGLDVCHGYVQINNKKYLENVSVAYKKYFSKAKLSSA